MDKKVDPYHDEFVENFGKLNKANQLDTMRYLRVLVASERTSTPPPTAEQWESLPAWLRWKIFIEVMYYAKRHELANKLVEIGLRLGGAR